MCKKTVILVVSGKTLEVDTSDKACSEFGFRSGDRVRTISARSDGVVVGVAKDPMRNSNALYCEFKIDRGRASYVPKYQCEEGYLEKI